MQIAGTAGPSARALLLTMLGEFALPHGGAIWTSTLIDGLGLLGTGERNARQAVARLADSDLVEPERHGRRTRWHLTDHGREVLSTGARRIYAFGTAEESWDGRWLVVSCTVPEQDRHKRHRLRSRLGFAGFGFVSASLAVSPHPDRESEAARILDDLDLPGAIVFRDATVASMSDTELLSRGWDLGDLAAEYSTFLRSFGRRRPATDAQRFAAVLELVHSWRRFPFVDPELPASLLPSGWPGHRAAAAFHALHAEWSPAAIAWFQAMEQ